MISEESCDTEDWSNDTENSALQMEKLHCVCGGGGGGYSNRKPLYFEYLATVLWIVSCTKSTFSSPIFMRKVFKNIMPPIIVVTYWTHQTAPHLPSCSLPPHPEWRPPWCHSPHLPPVPSTPAWGRQRAPAPRSPLGKLKGRPAVGEQTERWMRHWSINQPSCDAFNGKAVKCTMIALKHKFAPSLQMKASNPQSSRLLILTEAAANGPFIIALTWAGSVTWLDSYYASE